MTYRTAGLILRGRTGTACRYPTVVTPGRGLGLSKETAGLSPVVPLAIVIGVVIVLFVWNKLRAVVGALP